jgi:acyl-CoA thioester hydrolase
MMGRARVRSELVLYGEGSEAPAASGQFVHVYVDRDSRKPVAIPNPLHDALSHLVTPD